MQVWDTAGQERFRTITQSYYRSAHGAIIAYDITRRSTFDSVTHWIKEVELYGASNVVLVLIGECGCEMSPQALTNVIIQIILRCFVCITQLCLSPSR